VIPIVSYGFGCGARGKDSSKSGTGAGTGGGGGIKLIDAINLDDNGATVEGIKGIISGFAKVLSDAPALAIDKTGKTKKQSA